MRPLTKAQVEFKRRMERLELLKTQPPLEQIKALRTDLRRQVKNAEQYAKDYPHLGTNTTDLEYVISRLTTILKAPLTARNGD